MVIIERTYSLQGSFLCYVAIYLFMLLFWKKDQNHCVGNASPWLQMFPEEPRNF